jgi:hypothetical protein
MGLVLREKERGERRKWEVGKERGGQGRSEEDLRPGHLFVSVIPLEQDEVKRHYMKSEAQI